MSLRSQHFGYKLDIIAMAKTNSRTKLNKWLYFVYWTVSVGYYMDRRPSHEIEASGQPVQDGGQTLKSHSIQKVTRIAWVLLTPNVTMHGTHLFRRMPLIKCTQILPSATKCPHTYLVDLNIDCEHKYTC